MRLSKISLKTVLISFFLVLTTVTLSACDLPFISSKKEVKLVWWGLWETPEIVKPLIDKYQSQNPNITIEYQKQSSKDYLQRLRSKIADEATPDIFRFHSTWVPQLKGELSLLPASVMGKDDFGKTFYKVAAVDLAANNSYVGIPLMYDGLGLYWNKDIFSAAGVEGPPKTWDELRTTAAKLTVKDSENKIKTAGIAMGTANNVDHFSDILGLMMKQNGVGDFANPTSNLAVDTLNFYAIFSKAGENRVWDDTLPPSTIAFASGQLAMYFGLSWEVFEIKKANPSLNFAIARVPQLPGGSITWGNYWVEGVSSKSKNQAEAWKFLKFASEKEQLELLYKTASSSNDRLFGEPYSRQDMASLLENDPLVGAYIKDAPNAYSWYLASATGDGKDGLNDSVIAVYKWVVDSVNATPSTSETKKFLDQVPEKLNPILTKYGLVTSVKK